jgi:hypothetical protein
MHSCKAFLPQSVQQPWDSLKDSNTSECVARVRSRTFSMPSWQSVTEYSVTLHCVSSYTVFLSKVPNHLEISSRVCELSWCALLAASLLTRLSSDTHSLRRLTESQLSVMHSLHLALRTRLNPTHSQIEDYISIPADDF